MLTRKTFNTKDTNGCEFKVEATYYGKEINTRTLKYENHTEYRAMGFMAESLEELKKLAASK